MHGIKLLANVLHGFVDSGDPVGAGDEPRSDIRECGIIIGRGHVTVLIAQAVLERSPKVHCDRAQLDFNGHLMRAVCEKDWHADHEVEAAIPTLLGMFDVVLASDEVDVILREKVARYVVDVGEVIAYDAYACDVEYVRLYGME